MKALSSALTHKLLSKHLWYNSLFERKKKAISINSFSFLIFLSPLILRKKNYKMVTNLISPCPTDKICYNEISLERWNFYYREISFDLWVMGFHFLNFFKSNLFLPYLSVFFISLKTKLSKKLFPISKLLLLWLKSSALILHLSYIS